MDFYLVFFMDISNVIKTLYYSVFYILVWHILDNQTYEKEKNQYILIQYVSVFDLMKWPITVFIGSRICSPLSSFMVWSFLFHVAVMWEIRLPCWFCLWVTVLALIVKGLDSPWQLERWESFLNAIFRPLFNPWEQSKERVSSGRIATGSVSRNGYCVDPIDKSGGLCLWGE